MRAIAKKYRAVAEKAELDGERERAMYYRQAADYFDARAAQMERTLR